MDTSLFFHRIPKEERLEYDDGASNLPGPYFMHDGWLNDPSQWPDLETFGDIYHYLINTPGMFSRASMKAYKSD